MEEPDKNLHLWNKVGGDLRQETEILLKKKKKISAASARIVPKNAGQTCHMSPGTMPDAQCQRKIVTAHQTPTQSQKSIF